MFYPKEITPDTDLFLRNNIRVCGKFPMELIDIGGSILFDPNLEFEIKGKAIEHQTSRDEVNIPLFYVTKWSSWEK